MLIVPFIVGVVLRSRAGEPGGAWLIPLAAAEFAAYFAFNLDPPIPVGSPRIAPIGDVSANWSIEFEAHRDEGLLFVLDLHPELIGTPGRAAMLADLLDLIVRDGDVWVATGDEIARWWLGRSPAAALPADHPVAVFERHAATGGRP